MARDEDSQREPRPDADALLREIQREEKRRGRLKIFLGYAPGVGKTYAMLQEAHVLRNRGEDVVVGIVETHKRSETEALLQGLEIINPQQIEYKGINLREMGIDAILARKPGVVLVDELAHTNAPGSRHPKRYQDVEELLDSGIDVYTTVNIQHFESQVDVVGTITGIRQQETVPDTLLDRTDEVQVIDIPLEELSQRLHEGKVYIPEQARRAMDNFFQRGNLVALRELTLTLVARKMGTELLNYMKAKAISGPWAAGERLMVCIDPSPYALQLLRKAYTIAREARAEWYAVYVSLPTLRELSDEQRTYLTESLNLAEELGAKTSTLMGTDIAEEILRFAREQNITRIVVGKPRPRLFELFNRSPVHKLLRAEAEFELHLITPVVEKQATQPKQAFRWPVLRLEDYLISLGMVAVVTALNFFLEAFVRPASLVFIYLIATIAAALRYGMGASLFSALLSLLTFDFFFTEPKYSFSMYHPHDFVTGVVFFFTSVVVAQLARTAKERNLALQVRVKRMTLIEEMSKEFLMMPPIEQLIGGFVTDAKEWKNVLPLLRTTVLDDISHIIIKYVSRVVDMPSFVLFKGQEGRPQVWAKSKPYVDLDDHEMTVAEWSYTHGEMAGAGTQTLPNVSTFFVPMKSLEETVGVIGIRSEYKSLLLDQRRLLAAISSVSALAAARWANI
jgi:two-component system, OmpR family, sensor histidine kinase KdpD